MIELQKVSMRDRIKKLLKLHVSKRTREEKASRVEVKHSEVNDLILGIMIDRLKIKQQKPQRK